MDKYTYRKRPTKKQASAAADIHWWRKLAALMLFMGVLAGIFLAAGRDHSEVKAKYLAYSEKVKTWFVARKGQVKEKITKVKLAAKPTKPEPIKFEFYSSLPQHQFATLKKNADEPAVMTVAKPRVALSKATSHVSARDIFSAENLEKDLAARVNAAE